MTNSAETVLTRGTLLGDLPLCPWKKWVWSSERERKIKVSSGFSLSLSLLGLFTDLDQMERSVHWKVTMCTNRMWCVCLCVHMCVHACSCICVLTFSDGTNILPPQVMTQTLCSTISPIHQAGGDVHNKDRGSSGLAALFTQTMPNAYIA